jgi:hypothetical protein
MEIYLLKASAVLAIFVITYQVFLKNETFFKLNRYFLLSGLLASLLLPMLTITEEIPVAVTALSSPAEILEEAPLPNASDSWDAALFWIYIAGLVFFAAVVLYQIIRLLTLIRKGKAIEEDGYLLIPSRSNDGPFSFFKYIFYNPEAHGQEELQFVLEHEKAHGRQWHSVDILLARAAAIVLWVNPLIWWYQKLVQQNLEYLADAQAVEGVPSVKEYQYALLKVSGNQLTPALVSPFNQSLIKKRIVMLQRNQSKSVHLAKYLLILPMLALFLMAFNREKVYVMEESPAILALSQETKSIELIIDKNTTDAQLLKMKQDLAEDDIDFSYTTVRNEAKEIIDISFDFKGKAENGNPFGGTYNSDSDQPIKPIMIYINSEGGVFFGEASTFKEFSTGKEVHFTTGSGDKMIWVQRSGKEGGDLVGTRNTEEKQVIIVNGKEVSSKEGEEAYLRQLEKREEMMILEMEEDADEIIIVGGTQVIAKKIDGDGEHENVFVKILDGEDGSEEDVQIFSIDMDEEDAEGKTMIFHTDGGSTKHKKVIVETDKSDGSDRQMKVIVTDGKKPLIYIDGKKANTKAMEALDPDQIETINVIKGDKAIEKHGKKAKDGVVEITTKKG